MQVRADAGCAARAHVTRASAIRAHAQRLPLAVFLLLFFACLLISNVAYADDSWSKVLWSSSFNDGSQWIVAASNKYDAAAYICGKTPSEVSAFTLEQRGKLSTQGGKFQVLANSLAQVFPTYNDQSLWDSLEDEYDIGVWSKMTESYAIGAGGLTFNPNALARWTVQDWQTLSTNPIFAVNADASLVSDARDALAIVLNGGDINSGSYDGPIPEGFELINNGFGSKVGTIYNCMKYSDRATNASVMLDISRISGETMFSTDYYIFVCQQGSNNTIKYEYATLDSGLIPLRSISSGKLRVYNPTNERLTIRTRTLDNTINQNQSGVYVLPTGGSTNSNTISPGSLYSQDLDFVCDYVCTSYMGSDGGGGGGDDEPDPWPDPEPPVEPPDVPEPPDVNPNPIGGPVFPTNPPEDPTTTPEPEPTGTDYTVYLKAIIRQLNQVMVQMSNHCKHIRDQISTSANAIISNLHTYIDDLQESIDSNFAALNDYLEDLTKWYEQYTDDVFLDLKEELRTIQNILRQILRKIGVSRGTPREVEKEVDDDFNFLEWLINFITSKLAGVIDEFVGDVGSLINGVKDKFPFSIPWDIAAILAILDGVPVTPNFTITIPAINGWWQATTFNIDLRPYDSVAAAVRIMINAWWVLTLAMKTNWMLDVMGNSTSIGERIANRISGGGE